MSQNLKISLQLTLICCIWITALCDVAVNPTRPRQCYSCEGINCQRTTKQNVTTDCTDLLDFCVTIFDGFTVISKGCFLSMPEQHREKCEGNGHNPECFKCSGQLCNNKGREDFKCIECNDSAKCASDTTAMEPVQCGIPTAPNSYCFTRNMGGNQVQRGCYAHTQDQMKCMQDKSCSLCLPSDKIACNSYTVSIAPPTPSAGNKNFNNFALLLMAVIGLAGFLS